MNDKNQKNMNRQPDDWEAILEDVTVKQNAEEISFDPMVLPNIETKYDIQDFYDQSIDETQIEELQCQIELVRKIAKRKLRGIQRKCILLMIEQNLNRSQITEILHHDERTIDRHLKKAIETIRECIEHAKSIDFPLPAGKRPRVRVTILPLDTSIERQKFQWFLNEHNILYLSHNSTDLFREAMVVYRTRKPGRKKITMVSSMENKQYS